LTVRIGELLVEAGCVTAEQVEAALARQRAGEAGTRLGALLVQEGWLTVDALRQALGRQFHLEVVEQVDAAWLEPALVASLPVDWSRRHLALPIRRDGLTCALIPDPDALPRVEELSLLVREELIPLLAPEEAIRQAIDQVYFALKRGEEPAGAPSTAPEPRTSGQPAGEGGRAEDLLRVSESAPVSQRVNDIILEAVRRQASDIHIEPFEKRLRIRYRIDGCLFEMPSPPKALEQALISRLKVMSKLDIAEKRLPQDGMARVRAGEREIDIRVSTVPVAEGERLVLRLLNQSSTLLPLDALGMPPAVKTQFEQAMAAPNGVILVTGPTGSGKTTTLYAALRAVNNERRNVMTIEDPIEYQIADIGQIQVKPKIGLTFAAGLRHILRQDPDVILVGEIRDEETAEIAVRAALTGHLVFSTLHTNDAASAVVRLADMGVAPYLIASAVRAVLAQRLVRRLCPTCRRADTLRAAELAGLPGDLPQTLTGAPCFRAVGCDDCLEGYRGRTGLYALITLDAERQEDIRRGVEPSAWRAGPGSFTSTLWDDACEKIRAGVTSLDEVQRGLGGAIGGSIG
jgi:general secretion pathway protein E